MAGGAAASSALSVDVPLDAFVRPVGGTFPELVASFLTKTQRSEEALAEAEEFSGHLLGQVPAKVNLRVQADALKLDRRTHARHAQVLAAVSYFGSLDLIVSLISKLRMVSMRHKQFRTVGIFASLRMMKLR